MASERFRLLPSDRSIDDLELEVLEWWRAEKLFEASVRAREGKPAYVWFEGPPTANGRPGIHHVFARTIKDLFCRHRTMQGYHVPRKGGWDTHGLPVEIEVEKALGISGKQDIEALGVAKFNALCRESVWQYKADHESISERAAIWMDYEHAYVTYENYYIESVWWALKTLYDKGRLYRGHKILPYCPRCETSLSSHEVAQGYEDVEDPSIYVALEVRGLRSEARATPSDLRPQTSDLSRRLLVWTTTPWTLVSNVALAVHPDLEYVEVRKRKNPDGSLILADARLKGVLGEDYDDRWETVGRLTGRELVGWTYKRPLDWVAYPEEGTHEIVVGEDFVSPEDGTGIVHMAPAFGADDYAAGQRHKLAFLQPVDARGRFDESLPLVGGKWVKDADALIIEELKRRGSLWKAQRLTHAYPHCWRCGTPLLYYARESWFVRTTSYKDEMLVRNARTEWHPAGMQDGRFGEWLKNNIDWALSRDRYWGTPLPIWVNDADANEMEAIGSFAELAQRVGKPLPNDFDPHKPSVDEYAWPAKSGNGTMRRVPQVIDAWFDSGSMPFAQWHFPFENRDVMARMYPADFIAEGVDQTRGWFYSLLAIATGLGDALPNNDVLGSSRQVSGARGTPVRRADDTAPFRAVVVNDMVLDAQGIKMSKSRGNMVDPWSVIAKYGADAVRFFLVASSQLDLPRRFDENAIREIAAGGFLTLRNVYSGSFAQYANYGWEPSAADPAPESRQVIDRWMLSRLTSIERAVDALFTEYDATAAARRLMTFMVDDVSNWYVRLNRRRFWKTDSEDNRAAFATLHEVLVVFCRLLAPLAPFMPDWIHRALTGASVHLAGYVRTDHAAADPILEAAMDEARELVRLGRAAREDVSINVRRPLNRAVCVVPKTHSAKVAELLPLVALELNVKSAELLDSAEELVELTAKPNFRALGKKFGKATPLAAKAVQALSSETLRAFERGEPVTVSVEGAEHKLDVADLEIARKAMGELIVKEEGGRFVAIDAHITPELRAEGVARELVSRIQRLRKAAGFAVSDRIRLWLWGAEELESAARAYKEWIAGEVLARAMHVGQNGTDSDIATHTVEIDGLTVNVAFTIDAGL